MAENPLLPDAELRALYALLQIATKAEKRHARDTSDAPARRKVHTGENRAPAGRAALMAGTLLQLRRGDLLVAGRGDVVADAILTSASPEPRAGAAVLPGKGPHLLLASAMAAACKAAGEGIVLALTSTGAIDEAWPEALAWAQDQQLPLVLACADPSGATDFMRPARAREGSLHWSSLARVARRLGLPVLTVDGEDAVAVYRVMQESVLRARSGGGPAVLWAMLPGAAEIRRGDRPHSANPLSRLKHYLRTRSIKL